MIQHYCHGISRIGSDRAYPLHFTLPQLKIAAIATKTLMQIRTLSLGSAILIFHQLQECWTIGPLLRRKLKLAQFSTTQKDTERLTGMPLPYILQSVNGL